MIARRDFLRGSAAATLMTLWHEALADGAQAPAAGYPLAAWRKGHFQIHFIYTGVAESLFILYPDGTSLLIDCGDHAAHERGKYAVPILPDLSRHAGEWIARYVKRVNPAREKVDYLLLTHYHQDHGGGRDYHAGLAPNGKYYLSGIGQAMEFLSFAKAIDRAWPTFDDPLPVVKRLDGHMVEQIEEVYKELERRGTKVERFKLEKGSNQLDPVRGKIDGFGIRPLSANGRVLMPDGTVRDLYRRNIELWHPWGINENALSIGLKFSYGAFSLYTAGDFEDVMTRPDGKKWEIEEAMAETVGPATVAKINHHGNSAMCEKLVAALKSQVYVGCIWDWFHVDDATMTRLADRSLYEGDRLLCPGILTKERRARDKDRPWMKDVPSGTYEGAHVVIDVPPGGETFTLSLVSAADETMRVVSEINLKTRKVS